MPDTHLAMPRTLSAPYAALLEAEAPQTMTASDAPTNGTAAAAAAFARLLASGDQAMQPETFTTADNPSPAAPAQDAAHRPRDLRAMLLDSTTIPAPDMTIAKSARTASPTETSIIPSIGMTFRLAADRVREMVERANNSPRGEDDSIEDKAELERREAARIADCHEWCRIIDAMMATPALTMGDLFAKLERIACPSLGIRHLVFAEEEIVLLEEDVQRLQPLWSGPHLAARAEEPSQDAPIFAAYSRWSQLVRDCYTAKTDDDCERLSEQADQAALDVMTHEPATREGLAAQVFVMLHLEHGGTVADALDIDFSAMSGGDGPDNAAVQALVDRVKRLGRRDGGGAPQDALTSLYARWVDVRARFLSDDLSDEESDVVEAELDQIEDRLESGPVRCVADAIAMLGYFLTASNAMLDDGSLPSIDADGSTAWQRLLFVVEDAAELLAVDSQAPFRAMVAGLRQLMQQHVKMGEEAERRAEAYQIPEQGGAIAIDQYQKADDADLLKAFDEWLTAARSLDAVPIEVSEEEREPYEQRNEEAVDRLLGFSPKTPRGTAVILRYLFLRSAGTVEAERTILQGGEPNDDDLADFLPRALWQVIKALEALQTAADDQHQEPDAFADTVAAFEAEAPTTLALPQEPTGRMVDAGASAAGITPAQFQAAYAAAVEALKLERAA